MTYQIAEGVKTADAVVQAFARASEDFDPEIFESFLKKYPDHSERLKSYVQMWLMSQRASSEEIAGTSVPEERMLRAQSRMLMAWEQSSAESDAFDIATATAAFRQFSGGNGLKSFALILLDTEGDDECALVSEYLDIGLNNVPIRRQRRVADKFGITIDQLSRVMVGYRSQAQTQTFHSAKDKPSISPVRTWEEAVRDLNVSDERKKELLQDD